MELHHGDCLTVLKEIENNSIDSLVTDPPAGINFMNMKFDSDRGGKNSWIMWLTSIMKQCYRVLKPGAFGLVWALPRTSHWTTSALENAGFEIRDIIVHVFGCGMPKGMDVYSRLCKEGIDKPQYKGFNTSLKSGHEFWILVRKPIEETVVNNICKYGTGALNIRDTRIQTEDNLYRSSSKTPNNKIYGKFDSFSGKNDNPFRFTSNFIISHDEQCTDKYCKKNCPFYDLGDKSKFFKVFNYYSKPRKAERNAGCNNMFWVKDNESSIGFKAVSEKEKSAIHPNNLFIGNIHCTIKSLDLCSYLITLVTPVGGKVLDCFMGSGSIAIAADLKAFDFVGIEKELQYMQITKSRLKYFMENSYVSVRLVE